MSTGNELVTLKQVDNYYKDLRKRSAPVIFNTATGNPAVFSDGADGLPIQSLKVHLLPRQEGTGDPSPENIRSIIPWNGLTVWNSGINVWDEQWEVGSINENSGLNEPGSDRIRSKGYISVRPSTRYYKTASNNIRVVFYDADKQYISYRGYEINTAFQTPENCYFIRFNTNGAYGDVYKNDIAINYPSTKTEYEKSHITETDISFPSPVYGGTLDVVSGVLTVEWAKTILTGDSAENWRKFTNAESGNNFRFWTEALSDRLYANGVNGTQKSNYLAPTSGDTSSGSSYLITSIRQGITFFASGVRTYVYVPDLIPTEDDVDGWCDYLALHPLEVCYKLATPQEIQLTPTQLRTILRTNTIWSNANGDIEVEYRADTGLFLKQNTVKDVQVNGSSILTDGVANIPPISSSGLGLARSSNNGIQCNSQGQIFTKRASSAEIKEGTHNFSVIVPSNQHESAFYALAKLAGADMAQSSNPVGQFTDEAKVAIQKMLGIPNMKSELIFNTTIAEDTSSFTINVDNYGNAFKLRALKLEVVLPESTTGNADYTTVRGRFVLMDEVGSKVTKAFPTLRMYTASGGLNTYECELFDGMWYLRAFTARGYNSSSATASSMNHDFLAKCIDQLEIMQYSDTSTLIPEGTVIKLYGIRYIE